MNDDANLIQIKAKRPVAVTDKGHGSCPCCGNLVSRYINGCEMERCQYCGQALDWDKEKTNDGY